MAWPGGLNSITIPQGVTNIGYWAFAGCADLTSIIIPQGVTNIGNWAFADCPSLTNIIIPESVTNIRNYAFANCTALTSISITKSVINIGDDSFDGCTGLNNLNVDINNATYKSMDGVLYNQAGTILIQCPEGLTNVNIPPGVTDIGDKAFYNCIGLSSVDISESVTSIGSWAFRGCTNLTNVIIPESVTAINDLAFDNCTALTSITFNSATTSIYDRENTIPLATKIIGYESSTAKDYAAKYGRTFEILGTTSIDECFIATAAFGSKFDWPVALLRHFRDQYLLTNSLGTAFVRFYYHNSPPLAAMIAGSPPLRIWVRVLLAPVIALIYMIYHPVMMIMMFGVGLFMLVFRFMRRRYLYME